MSGLPHQRNVEVIVSSLENRVTELGDITGTVTNVSKPPDTLTLTIAQVPVWQRGNEYILTGYRRVHNSWRACCASVFGYMHNETVNIHSHLWAAVIFAYFLATFHSSHLSRYDGITWMDTAVFAIFLSSAVFCLACSALFHTATSHSKRTSARCHAWDYAGIVVLIVGSFYPCIYYGFFGQPHFQLLYIVVISLVGIGAAYIVLNPEYAQPTHRGARTKVFIFLGLSAVVPVTHLSITCGLGELLSEMGFAWLLTSGALYIAGALIYANRIPERLAPGRFDLIFASHQIFHVHVVLAALSHYNCILIALGYRHAGAGLG